MEHIQLLSFLTYKVLISNNDNNNDNWCAWNDLQLLGKRAGRVGNRKRPDII